MTMPFPPVAFPPTGLPCGDEDVFVTAPDDFFDLVPRAFVLASGADGVVAPSAPRVLSGATTDFAGQGVFAGAAVRIWATNPLDNRAAAARFGTEGTGYPALVSACDSSTVTMRAPGMLAGMGDPAGRAGVTYTGLSFAVVTVLPVVANAAGEVGRLLDYATGDPNLAEEERELTLLLTLYYLYEAAARQAGSKADSFRAKATQYLDDYTSRMKKDLSLRSGGTLSAPINVAYPWGTPLVGYPATVAAPPRPVYPGGGGWRGSGRCW